jgi:hypothetical protein
MGKRYQSLPLSFGYLLWGGFIGRGNLFLRRPKFRVAENELKRCGVFGRVDIAVVGFGQIGTELHERTKKATSLKMEALIRDESREVS